MRRYDEYKDTGIGWLPKLPSHWKKRKLKYCFSERSEKNHPEEQMLCNTVSWCDSTINVSESSCGRKQRL